MLIFPSFSMLPEMYFTPTSQRPYPIKIGNKTIYRSAFWQTGNNRKLGLLVPNCSLPLETCDCQGLACRACYARRLHALRPTMRYHAITNYLACIHTPEVVISESKLFLANAPYARFNVSGEITPAIVPVYNAIAKACQPTRFLLYTKSVFADDLTADNIIIKKSAGINYAKDLAKVHAMAESVGGYVCAQTAPHLCGSLCRVCWETGKRPVFFLQH